MRDPGSAAQALSPAARPAGTNRAVRKDVVVFTADDEFLLSLGPAMDDRYRSRPTDGSGNWTEALQGRAGVALVDAQSLTNAPEIVRTVESDFPSFAIVVVAPSAARAQWTPALTRGSIARLLDREALTNEAIAAALATEPRPAPAREAGQVRGAVDDGTPPGRKRAFLYGAAAIAVLAAGAGAWLWYADKGAARAPATAVTRDSAAPAEPPAADAPAPAASAAPDTRTVPELLSAARVAFAERHYLEPAGNNALELYSRVLATEANNPEATDGLQRVVAVAAAQVSGEIKAGQLDDATKLHEQLRAAAPGNPAVVALGADIAAARPRWLAARAREAMAGEQYALAERLIDELGAAGADKALLQDLRRSLDAQRKATDLDRAVAAARASLTTGSLLDASANGPRAKLAALQQIDRRNPAVTAFQRDYQAALTRSAREAARDGDFGSADKLLAAAADLGGSRDLADARKDVQGARDAAAAREQQRADAARERAERATAPAVAAAPPPRMPKAKRRTAPVYPAEAERKGVEGYAIVEFALTADGHTRDLRVTDSSPPGVFDDASLAAVRTWRFEPVSAEDAARLPRTSVRLAFKLGER